MKRVCLTIEYDGTNYSGWQKQPKVKTIQGEIENAILKSIGEEVELFGSGRTDAGVHALNQKAHFDLTRAVPISKLPEILNNILPDDIVIKKAEEVDLNFHARFSAKGRGYIYRILNRKAPPAIEKNRVWWVPVPLDIEKMRQGAQYLLGKHDFTSFRAAACQAKSPVKTLDRLDIEQRGEEIVFIVEARSFLHHQVRNMVGTLREVGDGSRQPEDIKTILEACDRRVAGPNAPACGLYLNRVEY